MAKLLRCQHVGLGQTCKGLHGDLSVRPTVQGSKVKKGQISNNIKWLAVPTCWPGQQRSNFKQRQSAKLLLLTSWPWKNMQKYPR